MFKIIIKNIHVAVLFTLLGVSGISAAADLAGKVVFVRGTPTAVDAANAVRSLTKGSEVFSGDRLVSGNGKIQVSMIDGAFISVQPETEFTIEAYKYAGTPDGTENAAMRLVKGGVRAVTGAIGKDNPESYKLHTSVATIGIRGTGYNTRLCAGDCQNRTDGLYHNTWEGTTYVSNNVESRDVPSRNGVYVKDINAPIEVLAQVAGVTAIDEGEAIAAEEEEAQESATVIASGDQRNDAGLQIAITGSVTGTNKVLTNMIAMHGNQSDDETFAELGSLLETSVFLNAAGQPVGFLFTDAFDGRTSRTFATIDMSSMLAGDNPAAVSEVRNLLAANVNTPGVSDEIAQLQAKPARIADFNTVDGIGWLRWTDGNLLVINDVKEADMGLTMTGNQSVHLLFGPGYTSGFPTTGTATYAALGGTKSTSESGATIGNGMVGGNIAVNFATSTATLNMAVSHPGSFAGTGIYNLSGTLFMTRDGALLMEGIVNASRAPAAGSVCFPSCPAEIAGHFPGVLSGGVPVYAGVTYSIRENDEIIGAAFFKR